jgi:hypothetical protein
MTTMRLSDSQRAILSAACRRDDGAVFPILASLKGGALNKVLQSLIAKGLIEEVPAGVGDTVWRDEDEGRLTLRANAAAREALGITNEEDDPPPAGGAAKASKPSRTKATAPIDAVSPAKADVAAARGRGAKSVGKPRAKPAKAAKAPDKAEAGKVREGTKQALLIHMLRRKEGATIAEIVTATGWLPHTVRGAMAGALKRRLGLAIDSEKVEGRGRVYRIVD